MAEIATSIRRRIAAFGFSLFANEAVGAPSLKEWPP
jgi:hypothetical protein